jgi:hypothetical protein
MHETSMLVSFILEREQGRFEDENPKSTMEVNAQDFRPRKGAGGKLQISPAPLPLFLPAALHG